MCGRANSTYTPDELYFVYLTRKLQQGESPFEKPNYNFSPTQTAPIVRLVGGTRAIDEITWGLIPEWSPIQNEVLDDQCPQ